MNKTKVFLGLGSNIGDRAENINSALSYLYSSGWVDIVKVSSVYETSPVGPKQKDFYNIVAEVKTSLSPLELLFLVKDIEKLLGRKKSLKWGPRIIDIDILLFGKQIVKTPILNIPHKEIANRLFVLVPLSQVSPDFVHPILNRKINQILKENSLTLGCQKIRIADI